MQARVHERVDTGQSEAVPRGLGTEAQGKTRVPAEGCGQATWPAQDPQFPWGLRGSQMGPQRRADGEAERGGQRSEVLTSAHLPCQPPRPSAAGEGSGPGCQSTVQTHRQARPWAATPPAPPSPGPLPSLTFLQRSQICHSDALTKPGNEWRMRDAGQAGTPATGQFSRLCFRAPPLQPRPPPPHKREAACFCHQNRIVPARRKNGSSRWQV